VGGFLVLRAGEPAQNVSETQTSRFEVRSGGPKSTFISRGEPHNLVASLFTLRPRLEDQ